MEINDMALLTSITITFTVPAPLQEVLVNVNKAIEKSTKFINLWVQQ